MAKRTAFTDTGLSRMRRPSKREERADITPGLFIVHYPTGHKAWMVTYLIHGQRRKATLGTYPQLGITAARQQAATIRQAAKEGRDLPAEWSGRGAEPEADMPTFGQAAHDYISAMRAGRITSRGKQRAVQPALVREREARIMARFKPLFPRPLSEISKAEISRLLDEIHITPFKSGRTVGPVDRCVQDLRLIFEYAIMRGLFDGPNPMAGQPKHQPKTTRRALEDRELVALWEAADQLGYPYGHVIKLLMLNPARRDEIGNASWSEIDWKLGVIKVPEERNKNRNGDFEIVLSQAALDILRDARQHYEDRGYDCGYCFVSELTRTTIYSWSSMKYRLERILANNGHKLGKWDFHCLRHTILTNMDNGEANEDGEIVYSIPIDVIQACANQKITTGVTGNYLHGDRNFKYRYRKRQALEWWANRLLTILGEIDTDNVIPLRKGA
jgi:integrase